MISKMISKVNKVKTSILLVICLFIDTYFKSIFIGDLCEAFIVSLMNGFGEWFYVAAAVDWQNFHNYVHLISHSHKHPSVQ